MHSVRLILYGTSGCHLCDDALEETRKAIKELENKFRIKHEVVDITENDELFEKYQTIIPVLTFSSVLTNNALNWPFKKEDIIEILNDLIQ